MTSTLAPEPRHDPSEALEIARELARLPRSRLLVECGPHAVFVAPSVAIPATLRALGRLRAAAFPGAFEPGAVDLDEYDARYLHLFAWNRAAGELVGAYRLGCTDTLGARAQPDRLYTHALFAYDERLVAALDPALELGRSFVRAKYRRSYAALHLLWRGIGAFVARHRRHRYLFGALTIPHDLPPRARDHCLAFLEELGAPAELAGLVRARVSLAGWSEARGSIAAAGSLAELEEQLAGLSATGVPPLLRHYVRLGARALDFGVDPGFGGSVDAFVVVDLAAAPPAVLERYLGLDAALALVGAARAAGSARAAAG